jgi:phosphatidylglycerophosphate synthase
MQAAALRLVPHVPSMLSANMITFAGLLLSVAIVFVIKPVPWMAGCMILSSLFLDFVDGAVARQRNTTSNFGRVLDATSDLGLWLGILVGLYVLTGNILSVRYWLSTR